MADYSLIYPGLRIDDVLVTAYDLQTQGYIFKGSASLWSGTPTHRTWLLAPAGFVGLGFTTAIPKGSIGICKYDGNAWSGDLINVVTIDSTVTAGSTNPITAGAVNSALDELATGIRNTLLSFTVVDNTNQIYQGDKITFDVSMDDGQGVEHLITLFEILAATASKAGLLSASDKAKLDAILTNIRSMVVVDTTAYADEGNQITESLKWTVGGVQEVISAFTILAATTSKAGLMSSEDKEKLNTLFADGYKFAGIATPSTVPMSTTAKIFYIATQAGNYASFDNIDLTDGINVLMYDGSAWSAVLVIGMDDEPTAGSSNIVKSGGVFSVNQGIKSSVGEARSIAEGYIPMTPFEVVDGKAINGSGEETTNANFEYWKYAVQPDHVYFVSAKFKSTNLHIWTVFYFDANNNYISNSKAFEFDLDSENPEGSIHNAATTSPANAAYMYVNVQKVSKDATIINDVPSALTDAKTSLIQKAFGMDVLDVVNNSYYSRSSGIKGSKLSVLVKCKVNPNSKYSFKITIPANSSTSFYLISYLDANGDYISGVSPSYRSDASASVSFDTVITTSPTCRYVYINVPKVALDSLEFGYKDLAEIEEEDVLEPIYNVCTPFEEVEGYFISTPAEGQTEPMERENASSKYSKYTLDPSKRYAVDYSIGGTFNVYALYFVDGNGDYISRFLVNRTGTKITGNNLAVPIPENADEVYINGSISDSSWIKLKEVTTTDRTQDILGKLRKFGTCKLVSGDYYINGLVMPNDTTLQGVGKSTKLIMSGSSDGYAIRLGARCTIQDLWLDGNDDLTYKGEENINIESIDMDGNRHGILLLGNTTDAYAGSTVTRCEITNFTGGGITCDNTGYGVYSSLTVSDTWIRKCCVGVNVAYFSEFNKFVNVGCWGCRYGCVNNGGNNLFSNVNFSHNSINFYMNGDEGKCVRYDGSTENGKNMGHGLMVNANLVHAGKSNDEPGYAVVIINIDPGFVISGVDGGYGKYYIRGSRNIMFNNLRLGHASGFELINMDWPLIISNSLGISDAFTPFVVTQNDVPVTSWDADGNGGKVYMYGCFVASGKATPQYLVSL